MSWVDACAADEIDEEDVVRFDHGTRTYAIYRSPADAYFATDGLCTHQDFHPRRRPRDGQHHRVSEAQWGVSITRQARPRARRSASTSRPTRSRSRAAAFSSTSPEAAVLTAPGMVIIGAGEAGARAAMALRENRYEGPVTLGRHRGPPAL